MTWDLVVDAVKAIVGLRPSFSAQVRLGEPGAPVLFPSTLVMDTGKTIVLFPLTLVVLGASA